MCRTFFPSFPTSKRDKVITWLFLGLLIFGGILCGVLNQWHMFNSNALGSWAPSQWLHNGLFSRGTISLSSDYYTTICQRSPTPPVTDAVVPPPGPPPPPRGNSTTIIQRSSPPPACPDYFRWIQVDLCPWKQKGITMEMMERARKTANFRLLIVKGKMYVESYSKAFETRDLFTWWGILQLLRKYDGQVPDLDLMFDCDDIPLVNARDYFPNKEQLPPPLFRYCKDNETLDIPFPDWSFWGWSETKIKPWVQIVEEFKEANKKTKWVDREPYAYWKGNPGVSPFRGDLLKCNVSLEGDWKARLFVQDWEDERINGFKHSNLAGQCTYRYKIYIDGRAWSVSQKYILSCDSPTLFVESKYYEFYSRALQPLKHYWPISKGTMCKSIKFAVDWGNSNKEKLIMEAST